MERKTSSLQAVILAAGKGVRMQSAVPKVLHPVGGLSMLHRAVRSVATLNPSRIAVVVGDREALVREELKRISSSVRLQDGALTPVVQSEQRGTGHAVQVALPELDSRAPVLILPGDVPLLTGDDLKRLISSHYADTNRAVSFLTCDHPKPGGLGRVVRDTSGAVEAIVEFRDCTPSQQQISEINSGIYVVESSFLREALSSLRPENAQGELYLTDIISFACSAGQSVHAEKLDSHTHLSGANNRYELSLLDRALRDRIVRRWQDAGVTFEDPDTSYIDENATIGQDSFIGAGTRLVGTSTLGRQVVVEGNSLIRDSTVGDGTRVKLSSYIDQSTVGEECQIGPFAHLRPNSLLKDGVRIGNFVELKNTTLEKGAKASHLSYVGDAHVGQDANIGAGTITCNYDGFTKAQTKIDSGAFIGSNSCLVAPVTVGEGAVVGAGSTITKEVPADALGVTRADQVVVSGWAEKRRKKKAREQKE